MINFLEAIPPPFALISATDYFFIEENRLIRLMHTRIVVMVIDSFKLLPANGEFFVSKVLRRSSTFVEQSRVSP